MLFAWPSGSVKVFRNTKSLGADEPQTQNQPDRPEYPSHCHYHTASIMVLDASLMSRTLRVTGMITGTGIPVLV